MQSNIFLTAVLAISLFASCKKDKDGPDPAQEPADLTLLKTSSWKVAGKQNLFMPGTAHGGGYTTLAFTTQQPGELRWYTQYSTSVNFHGQNEMILNAQGQVYINKDLKGPAYGGSIKTVVGMDTWKINPDPNRTDWISAYKNDQPVDLNQYPEGMARIVRIQAAEDGLLNSSNTMSGNYVTHYDYRTGRWKYNSFSGNNFVSLRYNGRTYVIAFTRFSSADGTVILEESDSSMVSGSGFIYYPMTTRAYVPGQHGQLMHASVYQDQVFAIFQAYLSPWRYAVVRVNLSNHSVQLIQAPDPDVPFGLGLSEILYNNTLIEADVAGNLYVVQLRNDNQNAVYSIRKYAASGGSELILKETDLIPNTYIHGLKFFNGKLHVAIVNIEELADDNPGDNYFPKTYHMQIICPG